MQALKILKSTERAMYIGLNVKCPELEDVDDPHVTLLYGYFIPNSDVEDTVVRVQNAIKSIKDIIPSKIHLNKIDTFPATDNSDGKEVIYAAVSSKEIITAHDKLLESLRQNGVKVRTTFPEYKPHVTLEYKEDTEDFEPRSIDVVAETTDITIGIEDEDGDTEDNAFHISKMDDDQRLVFGWAQVANRTDGKTIIDHQGDIIDPEELEKGAYEYVLNFRDGGEEHISGLRKKAKLVESCVFTEEKQKAIGIPTGYVPEGWWIGFHVHDDEAWNKIKSGHYQMFSIEGRAVREPVNEPVAKSFSEIMKFNPYHGKDGRFTNANGATSFTYAPGKSKAHDNAIAREKQMNSSDPKPMTEQEYLNSKGVGDAMSGYTTDKLRGNRELRTKQGKNRFEREVLNASDEYSKKRERARQEYREKVKSGELRDKTKIEQMVDRANGHPDNQATQAARRMAEKRGIDWRTGEPIKTSKNFFAKSFSEVLKVDHEDLDKFNPYHDRKGRFTHAHGFMNRQYSGDPDRQARTFSANPDTVAGARAIERARGTTSQAVGRAYMTRPDTAHANVKSGEKTIQGLSYERAISYDSNGDIVFQKNGQKSQVAFTQQEVNMAKGTVFTHNHPGGSIYSPEDISFATHAQVKEMRVATPDGGRYSLSFNDHSKSDGFDTAFTNARSQAISVAYKEMDTYAPKLISQGKLTGAEATEIYNKKINDELVPWLYNNSSKYGATFKYSRTKGD